MEVFIEISLLLGLATVVSLVMRMLRQPLIIGHIFTGLIVGPTVLNVVHSRETLEVFSTFGIALLLFIVGLGLNPRVIKEVGKVSLMTGLGQVIFTTCLGLGAGYLLGFDFVTSLYIAIALTFSSTIIILKLLTDKKEQNKLYGKVSIGFLLVQDLVATFALLIAATSSKGGVSYTDLLLLAAKGVVVFVVAYIFVELVIKRLSHFMAKSQELLFLFAMAWGLGIAAITHEGGFSLEVGALLAGVLLSTMSYAQEIASRLRPLRDFFIIMFFISLGATINITEIGSVIVPSIVMALIILIGNPLIVMAIMSRLGYTKKTSFKAGLTVAQIGEFSIIFILMGEKTGQISQDAVYIITLVSIVTIAFCSYMVIYADSLYAKAARHIKWFRESSQKRDKDTRKGYSLVLFGYQRGGHEFLKVFQELNKRYVVVDYDPDAIELLERNNIPHLYGDAQDIDLLEEIDLEHVKMVVSTITDIDTNTFLANHLNKINPSAVGIFHADNPHEAERLYREGASYVMLPRYVGSEKMSAFIRKSGLKKSEFDKHRHKHIDQLHQHLGSALLNLDKD
jgi:Kef-type K+ transport system membrane component KefB